MGIFQSMRLLPAPFGLGTSFSRAGEAQNVMEIPARGVLSIPGAPGVWEAHPGCSSRSHSLPHAQHLPFKLQKGIQFPFPPANSWIWVCLSRVGVCEPPLERSRHRDVAVPGISVDGVAKQLPEFLRALQTWGFRRKNVRRREILGDFWKGSVSRMQRRDAGKEILQRFLGASGMGHG